MSSRPRQREGEARALTNLARHGQFTMHHSREVSTDCQTEPDTVVLAREARLHLHERLEDRAELLRRNPLAGVSDLEMNDIAVGLAVDGDLPAGLGELHRVRDEVDQNLMRL